VTLIPESAVPVETVRGHLELAYFATPRPGRRIGLVFRSSSGREGPYRQLAALIGELLTDDQQVRSAR
jgi:LysR family transcriptional regulator, hydrogen peroxide-inducible genes activator